MVTDEGHSIPLPAWAGGYPGARAENGKGGTRPSSQNGIWTYELQNWWILILDPDSSEDSRVVQPPELSGRTRDVNFPRRRPSVVSTGSYANHYRSYGPITPLSAIRITVPRLRMVRGAPCRLYFSALHCSGSRAFASDAALLAAPRRTLNCELPRRSWSSSPS